jgi:two-component system OmpR family response regulator
MRVLLVEDDPRLAGLLQRGLRGEGYAVDISGTVDEGRWLARENPYDALIFDVMLPDGDGFGLCRELRQAGNWTPVLMLTARDAVADRVQGLDAGADDYLVKPHSFDELAARVRALIRRGARERPAILSVGSLRLDPASRLVTAAGRQLELTPKEFALLELFMRHLRQKLGDGVPGQPAIEAVRGVGYSLRESAA